jgi:hypothetical protein
VVLSGADGSGKTATRFLALYFPRFGSACVHWFRGSHLLVSVLARFLHWFRSFRGSCNPYYRICVPERLKRVWVFLEFVSILPHLYTRLLLGRICRVVVCERGLLDFLVWLVVTLDASWVLRSVIGRLLLGLVSRENVVYLYADLDTLAKRTDAPRGFIAKELAVYSVLAKYFARCFINTGRIKPVRVVAEVLKCLERRRHEASKDFAGLIQA